jgi:hypothetical protein
MAVSGTSAILFGERMKPSTAVYESLAIGYSRFAAGYRTN